MLLILIINKLFQVLLGAGGVCPSCNFVFQISQHGLTFPRQQDRFRIEFHFSPRNLFSSPTFCWYCRVCSSAVSADTDNQPEGGKKVDKLYKIDIAARFLNQGVKEFLCFFELSYMLWFSEEDRDSEVEASDYLIGDLDLVIIWIWWLSGSGDNLDLVIMIWWLSGSGDYDLVRWLGGMAAQAAAVLRDKRKRWENHFCIFTQFSAKHGWETWSTYFNRNLASQVRDGSLKRRGRTTPQFRSVKKERM